MQIIIKHIFIPIYINDLLLYNSNRAQTWCNVVVVGSIPTRGVEILYDIIFSLPRYGVVVKRGVEFYD